MKKIIGKIKYFSFILIPIVIYISLSLVDMKFNILSALSEDKIANLVNINTALMGILLTILTIYISFPKSERIREKMKKSKHNDILLNNIFIGIVFFIIVLILWLFIPSKQLIVKIFCCGLSNMVITGYYIMVLSKFS